MKKKFGFLFQFQIEHRKMDEEYRRQKELQYGKAITELSKKQLEEEAAKAKLAKKMQNEENQRFIDYFNRMQTYKKVKEIEEFDPRQVSLINEEVDGESEIKRQEKKMLRRVESKVTNFINERFLFFRFKIKFVSIQSSFQTFLFQLNFHQTMTDGIFEKDERKRTCKANGKV